MVLNKNIKDQLLKEAKDGLSLKGEKPALRGLGLVVLSRLWNELKLPYKLTYLKNGTNVQFDFSGSCPPTVSLQEFYPLGQRLKPNA